MTQLGATLSPRGYLIVNADDFGYSPSVNKGIVEAHTNGIVTSTSVMVDAIAADEARGLSRYPDLSVGLHFEVKNFDNVQVELDRQVAKFVDLVGTQPNHIDTHKFYVSNEGFRDVLRVYAKKHHIPLREFSGAKFIDSFFGMHSGGDVSVNRLKKAIDQATDKFSEIMCHVGYSDAYLREHSSYNDMRQEELRTICDPAIKQYVRDKDLKLCNWKLLKETAQ
ncbi:MAG: carbohydrate deacetylase [Candidatus Saccharibacteria bacterium]